MMRGEYPMICCAASNLQAPLEMLARVDSMPEACAHGGLVVTV
jgi:hypothetical protein